MKKQISPNDFLSRAKSLGLYGLLSFWDEWEKEPWIPKLLDIEETERRRRSFERRIRFAHIGKFKTMADFDWTWPKEINRELIEELFTFQFIRDAANVILVGPNGIGKSMIAQNIAYQALLSGFTVRFITASELLNELAAQDSSRSLRRRLKGYAQPNLLCIDEVGYLSYDSRHADLLFEVVTQRYQNNSILITTNKAFEEWNQVFPNAASVVALLDRLIHKAEIVKLDGDSFRLKEAKERAATRASLKHTKRKSVVS